MPQSARGEQTFYPNEMNDNERVLYIGRDRPIRISTGHRILHHDGKCSRPHGHNYMISVAVTGTLTEKGWIVDKSDITEVLSNWDHRFLVEQGDPLIDAFEASGDDDAIVVLDHPPTAEVMSHILEQQLVATLPDSVNEVSVEVRETRELATGSML